MKGKRETERVREIFERKNMLFPVNDHENEKCMSLCLMLLFSIAPLCCCRHDHPQNKYTILILFFLYKYIYFEFGNNAQTETDETEHFFLRFLHFNKELKLKAKGGFGYVYKL